jgi:hypothetical protein
VLSQRGHQEPVLTSGELAQFDKVLKWVQRHDVCTFYGILAFVPRLMEFVYAPAAHMAIRLREEFLRVPINLGPPAANTRGSTPRKDQAQAVDKGKSKKVDKGKGKMI